MANPLLNRAFYDAIIRFEESEEAQDYYYRIMDTEIERNGKKSTVRAQILRTYSMLFCDDLGAVPGQIATVDDVAATADRLYTVTVLLSPVSGNMDDVRYSTGKGVN